MVVYGSEQASVDRVFHALADATRRDILARTMAGERSISALAELYPMSFAAVQKHVAVLEQAALVKKRRVGRERLIAANPATIRGAAQLLGRLELAWRERLDRFGAALAEDGGE
jgi:DNA-binding transcriptional ArsR family regulator